ncbi:hypothetical protein BDZ89DRAFT_1078896 [Hymenopellis radicata]|nr:hypothetical protein BDZ89DRAFT_1078896 [Hymenopellis radicata]
MKTSEYALDGAHIVHGTLVWPREVFAESKHDVDESALIRPDSGSELVESHKNRNTV